MLLQIKTLPQKDVVVFCIVVTVFVTILAVFIMWLFYVTKRTQRRDYLKMERFKATHEREMLKAKIEMQELTFQHIARELHTNITSCLSLCKVRLLTIDMDDRTNTEKKIFDTIEEISKAINDLGHLSRSLDAGYIERQGLITVLKNDLDRLSETGAFSIESNISNENDAVNMSTRREVIIYRIAKETINNIIMHSKANNISIYMKYQDSHVDLVINDNGKGFIYPVDDRKFGGLGINNIKLGAKSLKGSVSIVSEPEKGTSICVSIPYK